MIRAIKVEKTGTAPADSITLSYDDRFRRRISLTCDGGLEILLDLEKTVELLPGDDLILEDGRHVRVEAASEPLMKVTCATPHHLMRVIWHIGNRHLPCAIHEDHILLRDDHVIAHMLAHLGAGIEPVSAAFQPEGGAYGPGRTHSHEH